MVEISFFANRTKRFVFNQDKLFKPCPKFCRASEVKNREDLGSVNCLSQGHSRTKARAIVNLGCARFSALGTGCRTFPWAPVSSFPAYKFVRL